MSNLKPSMIGLDKGLNLQVAKIIAPQGSALDMLNYEQVDFQGQKRIDGYTRYNGNLPVAVDEVWRLRVGDTEISAPPIEAWQAGDIAVLNSGVLGRVLNTEEYNSAIIYLYVAVSDHSKLQEILNEQEGVSLYRIQEDGTRSEAYVVDRAVDTRTLTLPEEHHEEVVQANASLRAGINGLPGAVAGLHWFRDRLYAVADVTYVSLDGTSPRLYPGDVLTTSDGRFATVLDSYTLGNTRAVFLSGKYGVEWEQFSHELFRDGDSVGDTISTYELPPMPPIASIFEARSEKQVLAEETNPTDVDFGWKFNHLGWKVLFEQGISLYGSLSSLNQNIEGVGTLGPTSTSDNNGAPAVVVQGFDTTNMPTQVNGWKSIDSNTAYSPNPNDIHDADNDAIYADAYISWDATTGTVTGDTGTLTEYSPNNTIRIDD